MTHTARPVARPGTRRRGPRCVDVKPQWLPCSVFRDMVAEISLPGVLLRIGTSSSVCERPR